MASPQELSAQSKRIAEALSKVRDQKSFLHELLRGALNWEIPEKCAAVEDIAYAWSEDDLKAPGVEKRLGKAWQIQPLRPDSHWGIFVLEFKDSHLFTTGRGLTGPLRRVLRGLVPKQRGHSHLPAWERPHLLFLCTHDYQFYRFAYFKAPPDGSQTAPLASFGWDPEPPARTVCEFNLPWLVWPESELAPDAWVQQWASAFDVERVTKRFYQDYADIFEGLRPLCGLTDMEESKLFTQVLLNRLLFLRFLERKGWLPQHNRIAFMQALFAENKRKSGKTSFYRGCLRPLFFKYLAQEGPHAPNGFGTIPPFINGGLFEEVALDRKVDDLPDAAFADLLEPDGLLYRYNFTVEESTPLDIDVAVDPEMLGKVFEKLVTGRHETGSYYTPRTVVSFMCREALKNYLAARTDATAESLAALVDQGQITGLTNIQGQAIATALDNLKAVDPACGSGAYLLGLLQEMVALYRRLFSADLVADARSLHELKLRIISHNLYGVDIDPFATNLAMLRLWLSLAVEADHPVPLPNLDFKIETGDSLLGPCEIDSGSYIFPQLVHRADFLVAFKEEYLQAHGTKRERLREHIRQEEREIAQLLIARPTRGIDWRIQFAEVLGKNRGFDIVLANPPYVRQELITDLKPAFKHNFDYVYHGAADLYVYFYARGVELLRAGGILAFIAPNKFFRAGYGKKLRGFLARTTRLRALLDFGDYPIFEAITYPSIVVLEKSKPLKKDSLVESCNWHANDDLNQLGRIFHEKSSHLPQAQFSPEIWNIQDSGTAKTMEAIKKAGTPLAQFIKGKLFYGIKTGCNEAFEIDEGTKEELCKKDPKSEEIIRPWLRGRNIDRWKVDWQGKYLIFTRRGININQYPAVKKYMEKYREMLEPRPPHVAPDHWPGRKPGSYKWYEVQDAIDYWREFERPKILYQDIATYQQFGFSEQPFVSNDTTWIIPDPPAGLLAILNSNVAWFFLDRVVAKVQGGAFRLKSIYLSQLPIVPPSKDLIAKEKAMLTLAERGDAKSEEGKTLEKDIDEIVVRLYGLGKKDIQVMDEALAVCGNRFPFKETDEYKEYMRQRYGEDEE